MHFCSVCATIADAKGRCISLKRILQWLRGETVLCVAWVLALVTAVFIPPDAQYMSYVDGHTLGMLFALMAVMAGLQRQGLFFRLGRAMLERTRTTRQLEGVLILLPFFVSMAVTNDVALITFVPFALEVLSLAGQTQRVIPVVVMQTIAANLGSMATPIGNPQNLYLYSRYNMGLVAFLATVLPYVLACLVLLVVFLMVRPSQSLEVPFVSGEIPPLSGARVAVYGVLFLLCLGGVAQVVPLYVLCPLVLVVMFICDRGVLLKVDYALLATFVGFFLFVGNLGRVPAVTSLFQSLIQGQEVLCGVVASQVISNVPAALLLSGFTDNGTGLLLGVNLGGLGTLIASMASLISYKYIARAFPQKKGAYLAQFTGLNVAFLAVLLVLWLILG